MTSEKADSGNQFFHHVQQPWESLFNYLIMFFTGFRIKRRNPTTSPQSSARTRNSLSHKRRVPHPGKRRIGFDHHTHHDGPCGWSRISQILDSDAEEPGGRQSIFQHVFLLPQHQKQWFIWNNHLRNLAEFLWNHRKKNQEYPGASQEWRCWLPRGGSWRSLWGPQRANLHWSLAFREISQSKEHIGVAKETHTAQTQ